MKSNSIKVQKLLVTVSVALFLIKLTAWYITNSVAILTDALESIVNVIAGFVGLYSIILSSKPKDKEHPYGHGKVEFLSSAIEGILIIIAGIIIIYEATDNLFHPHELKKLDFGIILIGSTALINYAVGHYCYVKGKKENSPILMSGGSHLKSDTYSTLGLLLGIGLLMFTKLAWIDSVAAYIFAAIIIFTGYKIIRRSVAGIMDESDESIIQDIVQVLNQNRNVHWIDVHNMRVINYAGFFHIDCHLTVPYYINVNEAHDILDSLTATFQKHFKDRVEFFIHVDGCLFSQCSICAIANCPLRKAAFQQHIEWTVANILSNQKHTLGDS
nr:cation transporter [Chitinophagaceae bacterium]